MNFLNVLVILNIRDVLLDFDASLWDLDFIDDGIVIGGLDGVVFDSTVNPHSTEIEAFYQMMHGVTGIFLAEHSKTAG